MTVLIPAYEPTKKMIDLVLELKEKTNYKILIVDDGSGKSFEAIFDQAKSCGASVLHHPQNQGKGNALKTGFAHLLSAGKQDSVICADCDGQHHLDDIIKLASAIEDNNTMVLGARKFDGKVPLKSRFGNSITAFSFKLATGIAVSDTQTGLRGYPASMLLWLCSVQGSRFEYELNLLLAAKEAGISIKEIAIATIYDNNNSATHFRPIHDSIRVFMPILKFCSSSLVSGTLDFILLFVFQALTGSLFWSVVLARLISSITNYTINRMLVFKSRKLSNLQSAPKYFLLVLVIMFLNYTILSFLTVTLNVPDFWAKLLTEILLFIISYTVQKLFVFKQNKNNIKYVKA